MRRFSCSAATKFNDSKIKKNRYDCFAPVVHGHSDVEKTFLYLLVRNFPVQPLAENFTFQPVVLKITLITWGNTSLGLAWNLQNVLRTTLGKPWWRCHPPAAVLRTIKKIWSNLIREKHVIRILDRVPERTDVAKLKEICYGAPRPQMRGHRSASWCKSCTRW